MALLWTEHIEPRAALLGKSLGAAILAAFITFCVRLYRVRTKFRRMVREYDIVSSQPSYCKDRPEPDVARSRSCLIPSSLGT